MPVPRMPETWVPDELTGGPGSPLLRALTSATPRAAGPDRPSCSEDWQRELWWEALEVDPVTGLRVCSEVGLGCPA